MSYDQKATLVYIMMLLVWTLIKQVIAKDALMVERLKELNMDTIRMKSKKAYTVGAILHDENTDEYFEVLKCQRIDILGDCNWGLTLKTITIGNK